MTIYNYSRDTGEFTGASLADKSPLESGVFHVPANATITEPPETGENEVALFIDGAWRIESDYRGDSYWTSNDFDEEEPPHKIETLGPLPENALLLKPAIPTSVVAEREAEAARKVWETVAMFYDEFTDEEQYLLQASTEPAVIVARGKLAMWRGQVWNDDERILAGLKALVQAGVLTQARKRSILTKPE